jgi:predicted signal transduction protein with EAL and GGDEF domain
MTAVAEGVETAEQADALHRLGYTLLQGYHFSRPVAEPDFGRKGNVRGNDSGAETAVSPGRPGFAGAGRRRPGRASAV